MRKLFLSALLLAASSCLFAQEEYTPTSENLQSRKEFADMRFGIFIHWGIYSTFGQGEWFMNDANIDRWEYAKTADAFYPHHFDANAWVRAIKESGAGYITITSRHHDGFSMWDTEQSDYNIVDATPYGKDVLKQLADACHSQGVRLHFYYSHLDWRRDDYPMGNTGKNVGKKKGNKGDFDHYFKFMNNQLTELLTNYGKIGAIWFDGMWDHNNDSVPFDWRLPEQYALIHKLQPACLVGNNHHRSIIPGEDIQLFERDLPGENTTGWIAEGTTVSKTLPLETCTTMNGMWGFKITDPNYKSVDELVTLLVKTAGRGANLLMNIGPQPNGELPAKALDRLAGMGKWMKQYGQTIKGTQAGNIPPQDWGVTTRKDDHLFVHILNRDTLNLTFPLECNIKSVCEYGTQTKIPFKKTKEGYQLTLNEHKDKVDYILDMITK